MTTLKNTLHDSNNGLDYTMVNGYYLPNLTVAAPTEQHPTGRWGRLHKRYLKRTSSHPVQSTAPVRGAERLSCQAGQADRGAACIDRPADAGSRVCDRSPESCRSTGVGAPDEQHPQPCRGNHQV